MTVEYFLWIYILFSFFVFLFVFLCPFFVLVDGVLVLMRFCLLVCFISPTGVWGFCWLWWFIFVWWACFVFLFFEFFFGLQFFGVFWFGFFGGYIFWLKIFQYWAKAYISRVSYCLIWLTEVRTYSHWVIFNSFGSV